MANSVASFDVLGPTPVQIKGAAGTLFGYDVASIDGSPAAVLFYDKATAPVFGVDVPVMRILLAPSQRSTRTSAVGITFANGIQLLVQTFRGTQQLNVSGHVEFI